MISARRPTGMNMMAVVEHVGEVYPLDGRDIEAELLGDLGKGDADSRLVYNGRISADCYGNVDPPLVVWAVDYGPGGAGKG